MDSFHSASWYRVADQRPRLAPDVRFHRHVYRGEPWFVVRSKMTGRILRLASQAHDLAAQLDGKRSVADAWQHCAARHGDDAPTQGEVISLLSQLHGAGLLRGELPDDATALLERAHEEETRERRGRRSPLAFRLPLVDPDEFLTLGMPWVAPLFTRAGGLCVVLVILAGGVAALKQAPELAAASGSLFEPSGVLALWFAYPVVKLLHELGHAFAVKRFGGDVHEMGILFLIFMPVPYVDASASAVFPMKSRRMLVAAAGIGVELFLAAVALFVWLAVEPGGVRQVAYAVMVVGGLSTLLFNGNPLLRFDGYYVFADLIEIPNLAARSKTHLAAWAKRRLLGLREVPLPATARGETPWLLGYAVASTLYQLIILFGIALYLATRAFVVGVALALFTLVMRVAVPLGRQLAWLLLDPSVGERRGRALLGSLLGAVAIGLVLFALPLPLYTRSEGVAWLPERSHVRAGAQGFVVELLAEPHQPVAKGDALIRTRDPFLESKLRVLEAERRELALRMQSLSQRKPVEAEITKERLLEADARLARAREQASEVVIVSPGAGVFVLEDGRDPVGRHVAQGEVLGYVVDRAAARVRVVVSHESVALLRKSTRAVGVRMAHDPGQVIAAEIEREVPAASDRLPTPALGTAGGGTVSVDPGDPEGLRTLEPVFQFELALPAGSVHAAGERAYVRFDHGAEPIGRRLARDLRRLFLRQLGV